MVRQQRRQLVAEPLESRRLLAGLVATHFENGALRIVGDEQANVFEIAANHDGTLTITPDRDTALNGLGRGESLRFDGVDRLSIFPGEGNDVVWVQGLNIPGALHIEDRGHRSPLDINGLRMAIEEIEFAVEKVERATQAAGGNNGGSIDIFNSRMGDLTVENHGSVDFELTDSSVLRDAYIKFDSIDHDGKIVTWNVGARKLFGYSNEEAIGRPFEMMFSPEDREGGVPRRELERAAERGGADDDRWHIR